MWRREENDRTRERRGDFGRGREKERGKLRKELRDLARASITGSREERSRASERRIGNGRRRGEHKRQHQRERKKRSF